MKKKWIGILTASALAMALCIGCGKEASVSDSETGNAPTKENSQEEEPGKAVQKAEIKLALAEAKITGQGANADGEMADTAYDADLNAVVNMGTSSNVVYMVPDDADGTWDIYLEVSKAAMGIGSTPVSIVVGSGQEYVKPVDVVSCAEDRSDLYDMGKFLMAENISLQAGDTITVHGKTGFERVLEDGKVESMLSSVGDVYLYPADAAVAVGYDGKVEEEQETDVDDPLSGLNIVWMGSSVTYGLMSGGYSMADEIEARHAATECQKYAISATTLVNESDSSYVARMQEISKDMDVDLVIVQLSTNDATGGKPLGSLGDGKELKDFDDATIIGAIEYLIVYSRETWGCPVVFYTGTYFESEEYASMVDALMQIQEKWDIGIVDLWNNKKMKTLYDTDEYHSYMSDPVHPTRDGYVKWWTPEFEKQLSKYLKK